jgi:serine/threonine-protein kinase RsbW
MRDNGKAFDASSVRQPDLKADLSERQIGGLGMYLMRKLMDEVHYESNSRTGNLLTMIKRKG